MVFLWVFNDADPAALAHPMFMLFQLIFGAEHPAEGCVHIGRYEWLWGKAIGVNKSPVIFGMVGHEVDERLETGAATSGYLDVL